MNNRNKIPGEIIWLTGNSGAGKTTLAQILKHENDIWLDGDDIRERVQGFSLTKHDRWEHNINTAAWAKLLADQGFRVIVSLICPYEKLREEVKRITGCKFIYVAFEGDDCIPDKPYERPAKPDLIYLRK